ncbi:MAG TPA: urea carboxylase-associated family protein [Burkholderiales bacterium]|nr:urea carboxylase-associated family protein [Burkholderiales bacterium]
MTNAMNALQLIPARGGKAARVKSGATLRVVNTHGSQVIDTWAFNADDVTEFMSMEHTRATCKALCPAPGGAFVTNKRRPILTFVKDTSPGIHDTLLAACDVYRYQLLGHAGHHDNCTENLHRALNEIGLATERVPCPLNLFMNIPVGGNGGLTWLPTVSKPGDCVELRAEMDLVIAFSACPMDLIPINGLACIPTEAHFHVL